MRVKKGSRQKQLWEQSCSRKRGFIGRQLKEKAEEINDMTKTFRCVKVETGKVIGNILAVKSEENVLKGGEDREKRWC